MASEDYPITVLKDRLLIRKLMDRQVGLIKVVNDDDEQVITGLVLKIGSTVEEVAVDNTILYEKHNALPIKYNGEDLYILREFDTIAIL